MSSRIIFLLSALGVIAGLTAAFLLGRVKSSQPPVFQPVSSPFASAIYANGIIESDQGSGANMNLFPEVTGPVIEILVRDGQLVKAGTVLVIIDNRLPIANSEQLRSQSAAAMTLLKQLEAQPRPEMLAVAASQVALATANQKTTLDQYDKRRESFEFNPKSISRDVVDTANNAAHQATAALEAARRQYDLTKAGAWSYEIENQRQQCAAARLAYEASLVLLGKYTLKAPVDGVVLAINVAHGSYASSQGAYNPYTLGFDPLVVMGTSQEHLGVRCYVDEILVSRLPASWHLIAQMSIPGTDVKIPLEFVRVQPYVSPKIELSNQRLEKVDLRVLPVIFRFEKKDAPVYPGQLVDVYIGQK